MFFWAANQYIGMIEGSYVDHKTSHKSQFFKIDLYIIAG